MNLVNFYKISDSRLLQTAKSFVDLSVDFTFNITAPSSARNQMQMPKNLLRTFSWLLIYEDISFRHEFIKSILQKPTSFTVQKNKAASENFNQFFGYKKFQQ